MGVRYSATLRVSMAMPIVAIPSAGAPVHSVLGHAILDGDVVRVLA